MSTENINIPLPSILSDKIVHIEDIEEYMMVLINTIDNNIINYDNIFKKGSLLLYLNVFYIHYTIKIIESPQEFDYLYLIPEAVSSIEESFSNKYRILNSPNDYYTLTVSEGKITPSLIDKKDEVDKILKNSQLIYSTE